LPLFGSQSGVGYPFHEVVVVTVFVEVFAEVREGTARPAMARVITAARTKVVFMGISWVWPSDSTKILALPDGYNLRGIRHISPLD
jgi:hypothetical protein